VPQVGAIEQDKGPSGRDDLHLVQMRDHPRPTRICRSAARSPARARDDPQRAVIRGERGNVLHSRQRLPCPLSDVPQNRDAGPGRHSPARVPAGAGRTRASPVEHRRSSVRRQRMAHNPEVEGSNPAPVTRENAPGETSPGGVFFMPLVVRSAATRLTVT